MTNKTVTYKGFKVKKYGVNSPTFYVVLGGKTYESGSYANLKKRISQYIKSIN